MVPGRQETLMSLGLLVLRLGVGGYLLTHGWGKLAMLRSGGAADFGDPIGIGALPSLVLVVFAELVCAALVVAGLATRLACVPVVVSMAVAAFVAHGADPWTMEAGARLFMTGEAEFWGSKQPALTFLVVFLALALTGAGRYSLDALLAPRLRRRGSARAS